jgi:hypothetical protein
MNKELIDALEVCLQRMEHGDSLEYVLAGYPRLAGQLQPLLMTAARARAAGWAPLPTGVLARQRSRSLSQAAALRQGRFRRPVYWHFLRLVVTIFLVIVLLVMSTNGILVASAKSIPGDALYPIKRSVETTQLGLVSNSAQRQILEQTFSERRLDETRSLIIIRRVEEVDFFGVVTSQSGSQWLVSGIPVQLTSQVNMDGQIEIGDDVDVQGSTDTEGNVVAIRLTHASDLGSDQGRPVLSPTFTPTLQMPGESNSPTLAESSLTSPNSDEARSRVDQSKNAQPARLGEDNPFSDASRSSHFNSGGAPDN